MTHLLEYLIFYKFKIYQNNNPCFKYTRKRPPVLLPGRKHFINIRFVCVYPPWITAAVQPGGPSGGDADVTTWLITLMKNRLRLFLPKIILKVIIWREQKSINYNQLLWKYVLDLLIPKSFFTKSLCWN